MKRNKHITINLNEDQYNALECIARNTQRKLSDAAYLLLLESINKNIIQFVDLGSGEYKHLKYDD